MERGEHALASGCNLQGRCQYSIWKKYCLFKRYGWNDLRDESIHAFVVQNRVVYLIFNILDCTILDNYAVVVKCDGNEYID